MTRTLPLAPSASALLRIPENLRACAPLRPAHRPRRQRLPLLRAAPGTDRRVSPRRAHTRGRRLWPASLATTAFAALALTAAGCGDDDETTTTSTPVDHRRPPARRRADTTETGSDHDGDLDQHGLVGRHRGARAPTSPRTTSRRPEGSGAEEFEDHCDKHPEACELAGAEGAGHQSGRSSAQ